MKEALRKLLTIYLCVVVFSVLAVIAMLLFSGANLTAMVITTWVVVLGVLGIVFLGIGIGIAVYHDAEKRGMPGLLWALVAALVPYFLGIIAYLIVRQKVQRCCPSCGASTTGETAFCASCGHALSTKCPACSGSVDNDAHFCPHCGATL